MFASISQCVIIVHGTQGEFERKDTWQKLLKGFARQTFLQAGFPAISLVPGMGLRIREINVWKEDMQLCSPYRIAGESIVHAENAFLLLRADTGMTGVGAACPMPEVTGETMDQTIVALHQAAELLRNAHIESPDLWTDLFAQEISGMPAARAAAETALYDVFCQSIGVPVVTFLGQYLETLPTSVTIGITSEELARERLIAHLRNGFHIIKLKIGDDLEQDVAMVHKLREWGGSTFRLRVDANQGYDPNMLLAFLQKTAGAEIELIEQPFRSPASVQTGRLPEDIRAILMADEDLISEHDALLLAHPPVPYGAWNIKLMKSGGITPARNIAVTGQQAGIRLMWGCNDESCISIAAALHTAFSCPATSWLDLDGAFDIGQDIAIGGYVVENGNMRLMDKPGLGVSLLNVL